VLWFFVFAYVLTGVGQCVHLYVSRRLMAGVAGGIPIENTPIMTWMPYAFYVTNAGPSLVGLLMTLFLYGLAGVRRLAIQLSPRSVGGAWLVLAVCLLLQLKVGPSVVVLVGLVGFLMVLGLHRLAGIRRLASQLRPWLLGEGWPVLAVCLLLPLGAIVLPLGIQAALGISVPPPSWRLSTYVYGAVIGGGFIGPGLCEEIGWRGFALPHLQRRYSALVSSLIIGLAWAFWHWPNFVIPSESPPWWHLPAFVPLTMAVSVLFTWVYNSTGGSLFAVVLLHGAIYTALGLCLAPDHGVAAREDVIFGLLFAIIAVGLVWRYGAANLSWRDRVMAEPPNQALHLTGAASALSEGHRHWGGPGR
jgi:membrane protease YdiL (CAAX protease family)